MSCGCFKLGGKSFDLFSRYLHQIHVLCNLYTYWATLSIKLKGVRIGHQRSSSAHIARGNISNGVSKGTSNESYKSEVSWSKTEAPPPSISHVLHLVNVKMWRCLISYCFHANLALGSPSQTADAKVSPNSMPRIIKDMNFSIRSVHHSLHELSCAVLCRSWPAFIGPTLFAFMVSSTIKVFHSQTSWLILIIEGFVKAEFSQRAKTKSEDVGNNDCG